ncbi:hypothetical protein B0H14DRAFT_2344089 [Mycena olivaceomarginata]|nr:hypothetical protein B0H14DRAFT_2344089 [Mycena olivaceomarginata]
MTDTVPAGGKYGTALQAASYEGHMGTVTLLLAKGADPNAQGGMYGTALQAASCQEAVQQFSYVLHMMLLGVLSRTPHLQVSCQPYILAIVKPVPRTSIRNSTTGVQYSVTGYFLTRIEGRFRSHAP